MKSVFLSLALLSNIAFAQNPTYSQWTKLTTEQKIDSFYKLSATAEIELTARGYKFLKTDKSTPAMKKIIADYYVTFLKSYSELETEVEDDYHGIIGKPVSTLIFYFSKDQKIIAAEFSVRQKGCSHLDSEGDYLEESGHYATEAEANKNNCFDNDVSWHGYSYRDETANELETNGYMEWSGH